MSEQYEGNGCLARFERHSTGQWLLYVFDIDAPGRAPVVRAYDTEHQARVAALRAVGMRIDE